MLAHRMLDRIDAVWAKALREAQMPRLAAALEAYKAGGTISDTMAEAVAEQVFIAILYSGEAV